MKTIAIPPGFPAWRAHVRPLLEARVEPRDVGFVPAAEAEVGFLPGFAPESRADGAREGGELRVPRRFLELAESAVHHRDPVRYGLLYRLLWRLGSGERELLRRHADPDVAKLRRLTQAVRRAVHKTHAFVRFAPARDGRWLAYHRPEHPVLRLAAPFFAERFPNECWEIATPDESAGWNGTAIRFGPGRAAADPHDEDGFVEHWRTYYGAVFNPARVNLRAMKTELPVHHWGTLPELRSLPSLLRDAPDRVRAMRARAAALARPPIAPERPRDLAAIHAAARSCAACPLHRDATGAVPGEGPAGASLVLVGEQPGDEEDRAGRPFVGPAGRLLDELLDEAGVDRAQAYVTNAVKHFKHETRGKQRLHKRPSPNEVRACRPLLEAELAHLEPRVLVALGATAAQSLYGRRFSLARERGRVFPSAFAPANLATWHPAAILRADGSRARSLRDALREDLARARRLAERVSG